MTAAKTVNNIKRSQGLVASFACLNMHWPLQVFGCLFNFFYLAFWRLSASVCIFINII